MCVCVDLYRESVKRSKNRRDQIIKKKRIRDPSFTEENLNFRIRAADWPRCRLLL